MLVTGATRGIGRSIALAFGQGGAHVVVHGRDEASANAVADEISLAGSTASVVLGDLRDASSCESVVTGAFNQKGRLDVLVNNAGANVFRGTMGATLEDWDDCINLDLRALWLCSKRAAELMSAGSSIINITSNHATSTLAGCFPYNVAKAGANALTQSLAIELAPQGIRVVAIAPGYVDTPINDAYFQTFADATEARQSAEQLHPMGRLGDPVEIAAAVEFFADSRGSGFTTGTVITIDGGRSALLQDPVQSRHNGDSTREQGLSKGVL